MKNKFIFIGLFLLLFPGIVQAENKFYFSGASDVRVNSSINVDFNVSASDQLSASSANVSVTDASCLKISVKSTSAVVNNGQYVLTLIPPYSGTKNILNINVTGLKAGCSSKIVISNLKAAFNSSDGSNNSENIKGGRFEKTITVKEAAHTNNYLSSLSVSVGTINFNKDTQSYKLNVKSDVTKAVISGTAEDSLAKVSGVGTKNLKYGNNKFTVTVTAENGSKKNYTITINREDNRSNNATLKSLKLSSGAIDFSPTVTDYDLTVPSDIEKIEVTAEATEKTSKVTITSPALELDKVTDIKIVVKAENGDTKTYVIHVTRKNEENKEEPVKEEKSTAQLKNIIIKDGKLTKEFAKDNYTYSYKKGKDFSYKYEKLNEKDTVKVVESGDSIYFIVSSEDGLTNVYCLHLQTTNVLQIILIVLVIILTLTNVLVPFLIKKYNKKQKNNIKK